MVAIEKRQAERLGVKVGSKITFAAQDSAIYRHGGGPDKSGWPTRFFAG